MIVISIMMVVTAMIMLKVAMLMIVHHGDAGRGFRVLLLAVLASMLACVVHLAVDAIVVLS